MTFENLIKDLGDTLNVSLAVEDGCCALAADDMIVTLIKLEEPDAVCIFGDLGEPPPYALEPLMNAMLNANHRFSGTGGATISRDPETGRFTLCLLVPSMCLDARILSVELDRFLNVQETWTKLIQRYKGEEDAGSEVQAGDDFSLLNPGNFISV